MNRTVLRAAPLFAALALAPLPGAAQQRVMLPTADRPLAGRPADVFAIGAAEGQSWELLSNVSQVAFDARDNLYVADRGNARVLVFDRTGRFVRQLGKKGDGPGEFQFPIGLAVVQDGSLLVSDVGHRNISHFRQDGTFLRTYAYPEDLGMPTGQLAAHPAGGLVVNGRPLLRVQREAGGAANQFLARYNPASNPAVRRLVEFPDYTRTASQTSNNRRLFIARTPEFSPPVLWGVLPDGGVAISNTALYVLNVTDARGQVVRLVQRPVR
ncbi:MAG TPA: 6-bladed beta-propeller, partial [Longimicrobium sp.]|nr:6-bladed beta-propeller [Longimicrobium sp.]